MCSISCRRIIYAQYADIAFVSSAIMHLVVCQYTDCTTACCTDSSIFIAADVIELLKAQFVVC